MSARWLYTTFCLTIVAVSLIVALAPPSPEKVVEACQKLAPEAQVACVEALNR